ncbi:hypothetical protein [Taklimakanibacter lacteus]|uniref:hypothetical protein n=1 Tax=Taklimakanibacter lacteus TaxID=2268456 RepID=UPI000E6700EE
MNERVHRRFAVAVVANLEDALTITRHLIQSDLEPQVISVIAQEANFAGERRHAFELARIVSRSAQTPRLMIDSSRIVALACDSDAMPKVIARNADAFGKMLLQWLPLDHAERLTKALARGEFLLLAELHSMVEERIAMRTMLRNCSGSVEVHDFDPTAEELRL